MAQWKIQYIQKEVYILSRPRFKYMRKEVYLLSGPSKLQPIADYTIITHCTHREKDLPQLLSTLEAQDTHREPATAISQALIASCKLWVDQRRMVTIPRVYRRTGLCSRSDAPTSDRQGTTTANRQNQKKLSFKLHLPPMKLETMLSTILLRKYHRILSTQQNQILLLLLYFQNQKKGRKLQKLQKYLHLHPHWRQSRNSPTLQDQESQ